MQQQQNLSLDSQHPHSFSFTHQNPNIHPIPPTTSPLQQFLNNQREQLSHCSYSLIEQFQSWDKFLRNNKMVMPNEEYLRCLQRFLEFFPYNRRYWQEWVMLKRGEENGEEIGMNQNRNEIQLYQKALSKNPKCFQLWQQYIKVLHQRVQLQPADSGDNTPTRSPISPISPTPLTNSSTQISQQIFRRELERSISQIGTDSRSSPFYRHYYPLLNQSSKYEFYKKIFTRCLDKLEQFYAQFEIWLENQCSQEVARGVFQRENKGRVGFGNQVEMDKVKELLKAEILKIFNKTKQYRQKRKQYQNAVLIHYFQDRFQYSQQTNTLQIIPTSTTLQNLQSFLQLINFQRQNGGTVQNISYHYERSIIAHPQQLQLWQQTFHYLQNETGKYPKVLAMLRNNEIFFISYPSRDLYFYWCDLEERENIKKARGMYQRLEEYYLPNGVVKNQIPIPIRATYEIMIGRVQFQVRAKELVAAKETFDRMLQVYIGDTRLLSHTLVEYVRFVIRFYKHYQYPKKLLKMYFEYDSIPFDKYLFVEYLEFMRNFENKEGFYDELMGVVMSGMQKAKREKGNQEEFVQVVRIVKQFLRQNLGSIYLIKISERRVMEIVEGEGQDKTHYLAQNHTTISQN